MHITDNKLHSLSFLSKHKPVLSVIKISRNKLENLNSMELETGTWDKLKKIYAKRNKMTHISYVLLDQFPALEILYLFYNRISVFPELTRIGSSLKKAYFNNNSISWVNVSSLTGLSDIVHLDLTGNILTTFPLSVFAPVSTIKMIILVKNYITHVEVLSPDVMASNHLEVTLNGNPFNCNDSILWIKMLNSAKLTVTL